MGLLPEFFMLLGIDIFLAMSLLSALLDNDFPQSLQYLFQGAALLGLGQLFLSQGFINNTLFGREPTDPTRFWISTVYLGAAALTVIGLNVYLGFVRRRIALATAFSGTVTVPTIMTSLFFLSSFVNTNGDVGFTLATTSILGVSIALSAASIYGFLHQAAKRTASVPAPVETKPLTSPSGPNSTTGVAESDTTEPSPTPMISLPFDLPTGKREEWEVAPSRDEGGETSV